MLYRTLRAYSFNDLCCPFLTRNWRSDVVARPQIGFTITHVREHTFVGGITYFPIPAMYIVCFFFLDFTWSNNSHTPSCTDLSVWTGVKVQLQPYLSHSTGCEDTDSPLPYKTGAYLLKI